MKNHEFKIQLPDVKNALRDGGLLYTAEGNHKNVLRFENVGAFSRAGWVLFGAGYGLLSPIAYARKYGYSKQLINHWIHRDGKIIMIYYTDGAKFSFLIDY